MSGSSTCRRPLALGLAAVAALAWPSIAAALDPGWALTQYLRNRWSVERGYLGGAVHALAQTPDGYLWVAGERGLVRFDGLSFHLVPVRGAAPDAGNAILGLAVSGDGQLLARLRAPVMGRLRDGVLDTEPSGTGEGAAVVTAMLTRRDGAVVLATLGQGILVVQAGTVSTLLAPAAITNSFVLSMAELDGVLWLGTRDSGLVRVDGSGATRFAGGLPDLKVNALVADGDGLLVGTDRGVARWRDSAVVADASLAALAGIPALALTRDADGGLWVAAGGQGLLRLAAGRLERLDHADERVAVTAVFEDRERNLWVGSDRGLERLRDGVFQSYSVGQGMPPGPPGAIHVDERGQPWFTHDAGGLYRLADGRVSQVTADGWRRDALYSLAGSGRELWIGRRHGGLTRLLLDAAPFSRTTFTTADGLPQDSVYAVCRARDGSVWAGTVSGGAAHLRGNRARVYTVADGLASNTITSILEDGAGVMWFGTPNGVSALTPGGWRRFDRADGLPANDVHTLLADAGGRIWVGTSAGVGLVEHGRVRAARTLPARLRAPVFGLAVDRLGWLWVSTSDRVLRVHVERLIEGAVGESDVTEYGVADGLLAVEGVRRFRAMAASPSGRIWIATRRGLSAADPVRAAAETYTPVARVSSISADGEQVTAGGRVPAGRRRVTVAYDGVSLAVPERVRFRYRLDGFDSDWNTPVAAREAVYTNLPPGAYRFRVIASAGGGVWTGSEAAMPFVVEPELWQTGWFLSAVLFVALGGTWGLYRLRVRHVSRQLAARFEERLAERTRIAQELHDTLLQGFVSASMQLHVAASDVPDALPARASLVRVHRLMRQVIDDGRGAVRGLRSEQPAARPLDQALLALPAELAIDSNVEYRVTVGGTPRPLHPLVHEGVYRIGREAVVNALRHADARRIDVVIDYAGREFRLAVRDDGRGIDEPTRRDGRVGHWGLTGMRERADEMGARLTLWSRAHAGTGVELVIPDAVAYRARTRARGDRWPWRWRRRKAASNQGDCR